MKENKRLIAFLIIASCLMASVSGQQLKVLFLGNSYTSVNNLPKMVSNIATSMGDTLFFDSRTPGGQNLGGHLYDTISINKIKAGDLDYVVLQEQSMRPSQIDEWVAMDFFPRAHQLDSIINLYNPCGETMFYMTWGYKNGNSGYCEVYPWWPYKCTYEVMDSLTNLRYRMVADSNDAVISPVGAVWHYIRHHYPSIELYQADESHPSAAGSYAAACCFYTALFRKDPTLISYNFNLPKTEANKIKNAVKLVVYDSLLSWHIGEYDSIINANCSTNTTGIYEDREGLSETSLSVYPNPFGSAATIRFDTNMRNAELIIYDLYGQPVKQVKNINGRYITLYRDDLTQGIYLILLTQGDRVMVKRRIFINN